MLLLDVYAPILLHSRKPFTNLINRLIKMVDIDFNSGYTHPYSGITTTTPFPIFTPSNFAPTITDSSLTCNLLVSRKRSIDLVSDPLVSIQAGQFSFPSASPNYNHGGSYIFPQIEQQHQLEMDELVYQHGEEMKFEIAERIEREVRFRIVDIEQGIMKKMKLKDDELSNIVNHNSTLEDKVNSLCIENQLWRDLAQTNEATANALRINLEEVLFQVRNEQQNHLHGGDGDGNGGGGGILEEEDDEVSSCGSNFNEVVIGVDRRCRSCGTAEASILLLPCRHLSLCTICGLSVYTCPVCECNKTASVHINLQ